MSFDLSVKQLANMIDHTLLKADAKKADFRKLADEATTYSFKMLAINSAPVKFCREYLGDSPVHVGRQSVFHLVKHRLPQKYLK